MLFKYGVLIFLVLTSWLFVGIINCETSTTLLSGGRDKEVNKASDKKSDRPPAGTASKESPPAGSLQPIVEKNIFSPERKDFPPLPAGPGTSITQKVRPQVILYGITLAGDYQSASLVNPERNIKKGERELITVKVGERIGDYKVSKIFSDKITLESEGDHFEVLLYDPKMPKKRMDVRKETRPTTVTSTVASSTAAAEEVKRESGAPKESIAPSTTPAPIGPSRRPFRREGVQEKKDPSQERETPAPVTPPITPSSPQGSSLTATPVPAPITPTPIPPPFGPTPIPIPPGMGNPLPRPPN
jgi:hypothetical protein